MSRKKPTMYQFWMDEENLKELYEKGETILRGAHVDGSDFFDIFLCVRGHKVKVEWRHFDS